MNARLFQALRIGGCRQGHFQPSEITWATFTPTPAWAASSQNPLDSGS